MLGEVAERYELLDPTPCSGGAPDGGRGAPGFGSKPTASLHILCMRDARSSITAKVWVGADGRIHKEDLNPVLSVQNVLDGLAFDVCDARGYDEHQQTTVAGLVTWLDAQLDWITRQPTVAGVYADLEQLLRQLRPVTGARQSPIAKCPRVNDGRICGSKLYEPDDAGVIRCPRCFHGWPRDKWIGDTEDCLVYR